jgi:hypothetical protein
MLRRGDALSPDARRLWAPGRALKIMDIISMIGLFVMGESSGFV